MEAIASAARRLDERLRGLSPYTLIGAGAIGAVGVLATKKFVERVQEQSLRRVIGDWALLVPSVRDSYLKEILSNFEESRAKVLEAWSIFPELQLTLPEEGWSPERVKALVDKLAMATNKPLEGKHFSGSIYSPSILAGQSVAEAKYEDAMKPRTLATLEDLKILSKDLQELYTYSFKKAYLWNPLHGSEFAVGDYLSYQVVRMVADMFGADPKRANGLVTSGGTESLMTALRCYNNWGMRNRGLARGEAVVVCAASVHAAVMKGGVAYDMKVVLLPTSPEGRVDLPAFRRTLAHYGRRVVCAVGSAPSFATGVVDPLKEMAAMAAEFGVGFHVDSCLGGFIVNNLPPFQGILALPGVTSLSADTHKNGWAPKGSSVLICMPIRDHVVGEVSLNYFAVFALPGWSGGVYGTPNNAGSSSLVHIMHAFIALVSIGKAGYQMIANAVFKSCCELAEVVESMPPLQLVCRPEVNVVTFKLDPSWPTGASYAFAHFLDQEGVTLSTVKGDMVHFCVTGRFATDKEAVNRFKVACTAALKKLVELRPEVEAGRQHFPGNAGLYGQLSAALEPSQKKSPSTSKYIENWLLGLHGTDDAIRGHFMSCSEPHRPLAEGFD